MNKMIFFIFVTTTINVFAQSYEFKSELIKTVIVENQTGDISVSTSTGASTVVVDKSKKSPDCDQTIQMNGSELIVKIEKKGFLKQCAADIKIMVPSKTALAITNGVGDIKVSGLEGELKYDLGVGDVTIDGSVTKLKGNVGTGDFKASGLIGTAELNTGTGDFKITYKTAPQLGSLNLQVGTGDAVVVLPKGTQFSTNYQSALGKMKNALSPTKDAKFNVSFQTAVGDLEIKEL
ncbi:DUF4097 family beta strand repeat-containing protein [bacterium]|nr:DUF4097 family beta strand repeat-containing protein [bacterium]